MSFLFLKIREFMRRQVGHRPMSRKELLFVLFAMLVNFCISGEYSITRPASQSIFIGTFSAAAFPYFWLATIPMNLFVVYLYNRFLSHLGPLKMMGIATLIIASINLSCAFFLPIYPKLVFLHFCWKDIYILLMFKQLWSMIHATLLQDRAKFLFGIIFAVGTGASCLGSLVPAHFASIWGTEQLFLATPFIYAALFFFYFMAYRYSSAHEFQRETPRPKIQEAFALIGNSRVLKAILLLVICMQVSIAFAEYQFNHHLEILFPLKDLRTEYTSKIFGIMQGFSFFLQVVGSFLLLQVLGFRRSQFFVPLFLLAGALGQVVMPGFLMATVAFIATKSMDFSFFGVIHEMLFSSLKLNEKFRAKAIIDVFAWRTSKSIASLILLGLQLVIGVHVFAVTSYLLIGVLLSWLCIVAWLFKYSDSPIEVS